MTARVIKPQVKRKHKMGRKSKLTPTVLNRLAPFVGEGYTDQTLAALAGVTKQTFDVWKGKSKAAKTGVFANFRHLYEDIQAEEQKIVIKSLVDGVKAGDLKAIELAMRRHPRLRAEFKEAPQGIEQTGPFEFKVEFVPVRSTMLPMKILLVKLLPRILPRVLPWVLPWVLPLKPWKNTKANPNQTLQTAQIQTTTQAQTMTQMTMMSKRSNNVR